GPGSARGGRPSATQRPHQGGAGIGDRTPSAREGSSSSAAPTPVAPDGTPVHGARPTRRRHRSTLSGLGPGPSFGGRGRQGFTVPPPRAGGVANRSRGRCPKPLGPSHEALSAGGDP